MNKSVMIMSLAGFMFITPVSNGQSQRPGKHNHPSGKQHAVSLGVQAPLGSFSATHIPAAAAHYSWSHFRFGKMDVKPVKPLGFTARGGAAWYAGKKEKVSGYPYRYPAYVFVHAYAGILYNPWKNGNISFTAGPALGIYQGHTQFNTGACLEGHYYFRENYGISPGILFMKESGADPLWAAVLKFTLAF